MAKRAQAKNSASDAETFRDQDEITLGVLTALERDANMSQRMISNELGVALGLANSYLKRCVRKGWVKIQEVPPRRYAYYLTPQGFSEKARLTGNYLSASFTFFRRATSQMSELIEVCVGNGWKRIAFAGVSELAEVGLLCAQDYDLTVVGIFDPDSQAAKFRSFPVVTDMGGLKNIDAVILTKLTEPHSVYEATIHAVGEERTLVPPLLNLSPNPNAAPHDTTQAAE